MKIGAMFQDEGTSSESRSFGRDVGRYVVAGERVPSVTEIIELAGLSDIQRIIALAGEDVVANAAKRGSIVHGYCQLVDLDPEFDLARVPEYARGYVAGYARFVRDTGFRPEISEEPMTSAAYRFAGTPDRIGLLGGRYCVADIKTPNVADPSWRIQSAGYSLLAEENYGITNPARGCLMLRKGGTYKFVPHSDPSDRTVFVAALHVAHFRLSHKLATLEA